ncbi:MAG: hypothetical protein NTX79_06705 [Candidatus Micrarchaeota archaeon]|nr:hypothetical protein [Candidatus Micrarchaeota archaeon]
MAPKFGISFDVIYYSAFVLICIYFLMSGTRTVDMLVAYPLFFIILSAAALQLLLYLLQLLVALKKSVTAPGEEVLAGQDYKGGFVILMMQAAGLWLVYSAVSPSSTQEFFAPLSLVFFAISLVQVFFHTYPKGTIGLGARLKAWAESANKFGAAPGMVALLGASVGFYLFTPIFTAREGIESLKWALAKFMIVAFAALATYNGLFRKEKAGFFDNKADAALAAFAFIVVFLSFEFMIKDLMHTQMMLASFASAYALLAYIAWLQALAEAGTLGAARKAF